MTLSYPCNSFAKLPFCALESAQDAKNIQRNRRIPANPGRYNTDNKCNLAYCGVGGENPF